jgi:adenylylsulfate kinase-like enzyme
MIIWFIGLSGSGKSYLAKLLYKKIKESCRNTVLLDGDSFREAMHNDLGYTLEDREINGSRILNFSKLLNSQGINVIVPILSIFPQHQKNLRETISNYRQIFIKSFIYEVEKRDVKNIYKSCEPIVGKNIPFVEPLNSDYIFNNTFQPKDAEDFISLVFEEICPLLSV